MKMKELNRTVVINIISSVLLQGIAFFSTPIFSRMLGAEQYGTFSVYYSWVLVFSCVMGCGIANTIATGKYHYSETYSELRSSLLLISTLVSTGIMIVVLISRAIISKALGFEEKYVILAFVIGYAVSVSTFIQKAMIYEKKPLLNLTFSVLLSLLSVIFSVLFIFHLESNKYIGRVYGIALPYISVAIIANVFLYIMQPPKLKKDYCNYCFGVGIPVVFHQLANIVLAQSDRVMMKNMMVLESEIGIYSLFYTVVTALRAVLTSLNTSWCPFYYDDLKKNDSNAIRLKSKNYIELFTVVTIGFMLMAREVGLFMGGAEYSSGVSLIPIITISVYFTFMYQFAVNYELYLLKTRIVAYGTIGTAILNIVFNYVLIKLYGMYGAAIATSISYLLLFIYHYFVAKYLIKGFHIGIADFGLSALLITIGCFCFYFMADYSIARWVISISIGVFEVVRITKRKRIF